MITGRIHGGDSENLPVLITPGSPGVLTVTVVSAATQLPLANASVTATGITGAPVIGPVQTNALGQVVFASIPTGNYIVTANGSTVPGYGQNSVNVTIPPGGQQKITIELPPAATQIYGLVTNGSTPVSGATVTFTNTATGKQYTETTTAEFSATGPLQDGGPANYSTVNSNPNLPAATYSVVASAPGLVSSCS